jgi:PAS domain S-box-containing protein
MSGELILVAEDSEEVRRFIEEAVLGPEGFRVVTVGDGMSALTLARDLCPDILLTDENMPGLTGLELIRRLRGGQPQLPAILMTSEGSEVLATEALRSGACDYLVKPFDAEELLAAVQRARAEGTRRQTLTKAQTGAQTLERRVRELEALARIGRTVTAMLDLDQVLSTVVEEAVKLSGAEEGSLLLLDEESGELTMRASKNYDEEFARTFRLRVEDSLAGQVISTGQPVLLDESAPQKIKTSYLVQSLAYVPLRVRGKTIGVLGVDNRNTRQMMTRHDMTVLEAMADYAAIAIENARLYNHTESERRKLETILTQTEDGVIVVDTENRLLLVNRTASEAFGISKEFVGHSVVDALDEPTLLALLRLKSDAPHREEVSLPDGRVFNAQRTPIANVGQAIVMQDITHLKELDRIKSEFVATVSHDLRSPLTAILGYIELLTRAGPMSEQQKEFIRRVQLSVEQITNLVTALLDLGRIEAGLDTAKEKAPIGVLAGYAFDSLRGAAEAKGITLEADLPPNLPAVYGVPVRLRQLVSNLLENAVKYTCPGGRVRVEAEAEEGQVILRVSDSGPGIPPADQPYLFDKFFRASNVPPNVAGAGLGLSIVRSIVDGHGGRIWVDSKLDEGSTFVVVLPAVRD